MGMVIAVVRGIRVPNTIHRVIVEIRTSGGISELRGKH